MAALAAALTLSGPSSRAAAPAPAAPAPAAPAPAAHVSGAAGGGELVYSNLPADTSGLPVAVFESYAIGEFGGEVQLAGGARADPVVSVLMASYACQHGVAAGCRTRPGAGFTWPMTLELYAGGPRDTRGQLLARVTRRIRMPYRPSAGRGCPDEGWTRGFGPRCEFAVMHFADFSFPGLTLPSRVILGLEFETEDYGTEPVEKAGPYNQLGVAIAADYVCRRRVAVGECRAGGYVNAAATPPRVGTDPLPDQVYINTNYSPLPCGGLPGSFGVTGPCWTHEQPVVEIRASGA
ncbi:MAG TPA: hypothetical protein VMI13_13765 [Solirubrobacteraceae bacterium]|nr:hypothetical protein [Solirubrobacteraceae bacterium]